MCHFLPSSTQSTSTAHHAPARSASPPAHFMSLCLCVSPNIYPANSLKNTIMWFWSWLDMPEYYQRSNNGPISRFAHKLSITISDSQWIWGSGFIIYGSDWEKKHVCFSSFLKLFTADVSTVANIFNEMPDWQVFHPQSGDFVQLLAKKLDLFVI